MGHYHGGEMALQDGSATSSVTQGEQTITRGQEKARVQCAWLEIRISTVNTMIHR